jgi:hypothetical protein
MDHQVEKLETGEKLVWKEQLLKVRRKQKDRVLVCCCICLMVVVTALQQSSQSPYFAQDAIINQSLRPTLPLSCPVELTDLIQAGWSRDCASRPSASEYALKLQGLCRTVDSSVVAAAGTLLLTLRACVPV